MVDMVKDPERHQGLHCIRVQLREAGVQVQQCLPEEQVNGQSEPLEEIVPVYSYTAGGGLVS